MPGQRIGYVRVSSFDQNPERQLENISLTKESPLPANSALVPYSKF
jgi:hypothetical protein